MAADSFTEVTSQSWFSRLGGAIKGVLIGIVLFLVAFPLLFWNEGRAVKTHKSLKQGSSEVISVATDKVDPANEGKLVHLTGLADVSDDLTDETFGISAKALRLRRDVDMYQWKETKTTDEKKKLGGGKETTTTYSYEKGWFSEHINSGSFKKPAGHENPATMAHKSTEMTAKDARLGAFQLTESLVGKIDNFRALAIADDTEVPDSLGDKASVAHGGFYIGPNPSSPAIGDLRIFFKEVPPTEISMVSAQTGDSFSPFKADAGGTIQLLQTGKVDAAAMFEKAHSDNKMLTWILRAVGVILMTIGSSSSTFQTTQPWGKRRPTRFPPNRMIGCFHRPQYLPSVQEFLGFGISHRATAQIGQPGDHHSCRLAPGVGVDHAQRGHRQTDSRPAILPSRSRPIPQPPPPDPPISRTAGTSGNPNSYPVIIPQSCSSCPAPSRLVPMPASDQPGRRLLEALGRPVPRRRTVRRRPGHRLLRQGPGRPLRLGQSNPRRSLRTRGTLTGQSAARFSSSFPLRSVKPTPARTGKSSAPAVESATGSNSTSTRTAAAAGVSPTRNRSPTKPGTSSACAESPATCAAPSKAAETSTACPACSTTFIRISTSRCGSGNSPRWPNSHPISSISGSARCSSSRCASS
jgi:hypothetical protein